MDADMAAEEHPTHHADRPGQCLRHFERKDHRRPVPHHGDADFGCASSTGKRGRHQERGQFLVRAGDVISVYCTGLGPVNPAVAEGIPASSTVLSRTVTPVTATVGGQTATVNFAGLAPTFTGLYQVNVVIPNGVAPGDNVPVV